jgi:hypothetical protein
MSWDDHNRRRAAIKSVLAYAEKNPATGLPYEYVPEAKASFRSRRELLLALQYDWSQALWGRIELHSLDTKGRALKDASEIARLAWEDCASRYPVLRRLLDTHREEIGPSGGRERDLMVTAGIGHTADQKVYRTSYVA